MPGKIVIIIAAWTMTTITARAQDSPQQGGYVEVIDTIQYADYLLREMDDRITDTTLQGNFHTTGVIEDLWPHLMTLGYSGSPVYSPFYYVPRDAGWDPGFHAFDPYRKDFGDMLFIKNGLPITKVTYVQTPQVNQSIFNGYFARKFNDLSFVIDHNRYNFTGDYLNQRSFNTIFHTGLTLDKEKWYAYLLFASEVFQQNNNGGITTDSLYFGPQQDVYENRAGYPIRFRNGVSRDDSKMARTGWMLKALRFQQYGVNAGVQIDYRQRQFSVTSEAPMQDLPYFPEYQPDGVNGLNTYIKTTGIMPAAILEFSDSTKSVFTLRSLTGVNFNKIQWINQQQNWQEFVQQGDLNLNTSFMNLNGHLDLRLYNKNVYFDLSGELRTDWRGFAVSARAALKRTPTPWLYRYQNFSGDTFWDLDPPSAFTQLLGGTIEYQSDNLEAGLRLTQLFQTNLNFLNHQGLPDTISHQTSVSLNPRLNLHLGIFHLENELNLLSSDQIIPSYPTLSGKHSIYLEDKWFKNRMHLNIGLSVYWKNSHEAYYFLPYVQSFIPADKNLPSEYRVNPFVAFRVRTFKFFVRMENSNLFWQKERILFDAYHYPLRDPSLRMGIEWIFRN